MNIAIQVAAFGLIKRSLTFNNNKYLMALMSWGIFISFCVFCVSFLRFCVILRLPKIEQASLLFVNLQRYIGISLYTSIAFSINYQQ